MNKVNKLALGAAALVVISVFLPWVEVTVTNSSSDVSEGLEQLSIQGSAIGYGLFGLLVILFGGYLAYKEFRWTFVAGVINVIDGYGYLHGWFGASTQDSGNYGDVASKSSVDPQFGLYLFILASMTFVFFTLKYNKIKKAETVLPSEPERIENRQATTQNPATTQQYQTSKIQTMTTMTTPSSETPKEPLSAETLQVPVQPAQEPVQTVFPEAAPVYHQAPQATTPPQQPLTEPEKKKSSTSSILLIILALVLVGAGVFYFTNNSSQKNKDKTEVSVNGEKARLDLIINEVNQAVSQKNYDEALLKINSINWLYEPDANKGYVDQYNSQRENLRNTIEQLKTSERLDVQNKAIEEAINAPEVPVQAVQPVDSVQ